MSNLSNLIIEELNLEGEISITLTENFHKFILCVRIPTSSTIAYIKFTETINKIKFDNDSITISDNGEEATLEEVDDQDELDSVISSNSNSLCISFHKNNNQSLIRIYCLESFIAYLKSDYSTHYLAEEIYSRISKSIFINKKKMVFQLNPFDNVNITEFEHSSDCLIVTNKTSLNNDIDDNSSYRLENLMSYSKIINSSISFDLAPHKIKFNSTIQSYSKSLVEICNFSSELISMILLSNYAIIKDNLLEFQFEKKLLSLDKEILEDNFNSIARSSYTSIFKWIKESSNSTRIEEQLIIIRDILCNKLSTDNLFTSENDLDTIKSAYNIYIKGYTKLFLETKQGIIGQINSIITEYYDNLNNYTTAFKQSFFGILTFMFLTVGLNSFSEDNATSLFENNDYILILSVTLFVINLFNLLSDYGFKKRFQLARCKMDSLKECYVGLISKNELMKLFNSSNDKNLVVQQYRKIYIAYSLTWSILTISGFLLAVTKTKAFSNDIITILIVLYCFVVFLIKMSLISDIMKTQD